MDYRVLQNAIRAEPFTPFDVVMSNGERYRVAHPANLIVLRDGVFIPIFSSGGTSRDAVADDSVRVSYLHVAAVETVADEALGN